MSACREVVVGRIHARAKARMLEPRKCSCVHSSCAHRAAGDKRGAPGRGGRAWPTGPLVMRLEEVSRGAERRAFVETPMCLSLARCHWLSVQQEVKPHLPVTSLFPSVPLTPRSKTQACGHSAP